MNKISNWLWLMAGLAVGFMTVGPVVTAVLFVLILCLVLIHVRYQRHLAEQARREHQDRPQDEPVTRKNAA